MFHNKSLMEQSIRKIARYYKYTVLSFVFLLVISAIEISLDGTSSSLLSTVSKLELGATIAFMRGVYFLKKEVSSIYLAIPWAVASYFAGLDIILLFLLNMQVKESLRRSGYVLGFWGQTPKVA